jgi:dolichyl-diphosphooligosaccharide--protein glycosyltransferase
MYGERVRARVERAMRPVSSLVLVSFSFLFIQILISAYEIRLYAINSYGLVIHEFDPWFNFRATQYLADNGWEAFFHWFDYRSWYPLGRPVGTTIYPGMQIVSVGIWKALERLGHPMSLNDVCCFVPAWFGAIATFFLMMVTWECSGSANAGVAAGAVMAIIPAHIMRSVGGGYDNESVAMTVSWDVCWCAWGNPRCL